MNKGLFTPPSLQGSIQMPGNSGGANWGLSAVDPVKGTMYVVSKEQPALLTLRELNAKARRRRSAARRTRTTDPRGPDPRQMPPNLPAGFVPYGAVGAVRQHAGRGHGTAAHRSAVVADHRLRLEQGDDSLAGSQRRDAAARRLAEYEARAASRARAGMVVTAGGLIFIGTPDRKLRAYDEDSGKVVWEKEITGPINGVPAVYESEWTRVMAVCVGARRPAGARRRRRARIRR